ncbi:MAG: protein kinase [Acidobacteria bacterium]|nr:protein kinase [Acidobacteriota bacterium]MBV9476388.1 protein kinase [Acidobacteriota bacterium]
MAFFCIHCKSEVDPKFKACPFCGEPITEFLRRYLETPLDGKYQILSRLGVGGMGEVYKVLHIHLNAIRVIKLMRANIATDPAAHERFLREARLATKIHHPNVATLFDFSTLDETSRYMVWEYIEGINLHELIDQRGPLSPRYAARLAVEALHGLDAIHRAGIVHRDVSPENLMITRDDEGDERVKIIDLGIAKGSGAEDNKTKTGMFVGKWKYCSPEHLGMLPPGERIDGRADLYSFGIVFYEMLTGVPPFQADTPHAFLMMHASQRPRALRETNPGIAVPPELEALIFRALEKDRNNRFASAREFATAIERIAPSLSDEAGAPPPLPASAELTDNATRMSAREPNDVATVMSVASHAPTVATERPTAAAAERAQPAAQRTLHRVPPAEEAPQPSARRGGLFVAAIVLVLLALGAFAWMKMRGGDAKPDVAAPPLAAAAVPSPAIAAAPGHLGINAFPWANVTSIRNLDRNENVEVGALVTPAPVDLPPGRYEVTLSNPNFPAPITRTVNVAAGRDATLSVQFADPASAALPDFGAAR